MRLIRGRMPSPAMVIALIALFSSLGGVSYGLAKGAINGREVKNRSLTGKDLKKDSVGGTVVKESDLGVVPGAAFASQAGGVTHFAAVTAEGVPLARRGVADLLQDQRGRRLPGGLRQGDHATAPTRRRS